MFDLATDNNSYFDDQVRRKDGVPEPGRNGIGYDKVLETFFRTGNWENIFDVTDFRALYQTSKECTVKCLYFITLRTFFPGFLTAREVDYCEQYKKVMPGKYPGRFKSMICYP